MDIQSQVEKELHKIHRTRNRIGYAPNLLALLVSVYFQRAALAIDARWFLAIGFVVLGSMIRVLMNEVYFEQWEKKIFWARAVNALGFFILAAGWVLHFSDIFYHYGAMSPNVTYTVLVLVAFITAAAVSMVAAKECYYIFVGTITFGVIGIYLDNVHVVGEMFVVFNMLIFLFFSYSSYKVTLKQLCALLESQIRTKKEKEKLDIIIDTVPGLVSLYDKNLICYMANNAALEMFPDIVGKHVSQIGQTGQFGRFLNDFMESDKKSDVAEHNAVIDGKNTYGLVNVKKTDDGGCIAIAIITTELVEAKKLLREQEAKAQYSAKLASLGQMAAGIAHEVNNPLTIIQGSANIIKRLVSTEPIDTQNVRLLSQKISETSDRIAKTIRSLKAISRNGENDPMVDVAISHVLDICADISEQRVRHHEIQLKINNEWPDIFIKGREVQLSQVMVNLLGNAIDAIKDLPDRWITIDVKKSGEWVDIFVVDSGKGIPKEIREKIMEPFFTTKGVNEGTGLGLSISKRIIHDHGGELSLMPDETHTTFRISIPLKN